MSKYKETIAENNQRETRFHESFAKTGHNFILVEGKRKKLTMNDYCSNCKCHYGDLQVAVDNYFSDIYVDIKAGKFPGMTCNEIIIKGIIE